MDFIKGLSRKRIILAITLFLLMVVVLALICAFTSQDNVTSNVKSKEIAKSIESVFAKFFTVNHNGYFWRVTLNNIVRKVAHFLEYMMLGISICAFLNVLLLGLRSSAVISAVFCPMVAMIDEFRQYFVAGRNPRLFDVMIDTSGAYFGIILVLVVFTAVWRIVNESRETTRQE